MTDVYTRLSLFMKTPRLKHVTWQDLWSGCNLRNSVVLRNSIHDNNNKSKISIPSALFTYVNWTGSSVSILHYANKSRLILGLWGWSLIWQRELRHTTVISTFPRMGIETLFECNLGTTRPCFVSTDENSEGNSYHNL